MWKTITISKFFFGIGLIVLSLSQEVKAQVFIGPPNFDFSQACANVNFNTFNVTFAVSGEAGLNSDNQFIVQLSDANGSFAAPTDLTTSSIGTYNLNFSLPTTTGGEFYRIRVKSTSPAVNGQPSPAFPAYYKLQDTPFSINNLIGTATYCAGGSYLLTIDNPGTGLNDSPLNYPSLTYNWFRETSATTSVFVANGNSLSVDSPGTYFVETNYGTCTSDSFSNRVTISEATSGSTTSISSSLGNPFCPSNGPTTLSTTNGNSFQWYLDGIAIPQATNQSYVTDQSGVFSVSIDLGSCVATASMDLQSNQFESSLNVDDENQMEVGDTLDVILTTTAINPSFQWFLNGVIIPDATTNTYEATQIGDYKIVISQTSGCLTSNEILFSIVEPVDLFPDVAEIPNVISPNGDGINDTWIIPTEFVSGTDSEVIIMDSFGATVLKTNDYQNNWPREELNFKSVTPVYYYFITSPEGNSKKGSITVVR